MGKDKDSDSDSVRKSSASSDTHEYLSDNSSISSMPTVSEETQQKTTKPITLQEKSISKEERNSKEQLLNALQDNYIDIYNAFQTDQSTYGELDILGWFIDKIRSHPTNGFRLARREEFEINGEHPLEYIVNQGYLIDRKDPIAWAVSKNLQIYGQDPILWAIEQNKTIDGKDPIAWAVENSRKVFVSNPGNSNNKTPTDPIAWAVTNDKKIEEKDPIIWAVENNKKIGRIDPLAWAVENNKKIGRIDPLAWAVEKSKKVFVSNPDNSNNKTSIEPLAWAIQKNKKIAGKDPLVYAVLNEKNIEGQDPIDYFKQEHTFTWELFKNSSITPHPLEEIIKNRIEQSILIEGKDPIEFAQQLGIKIDGKSAMQYAADNSLEIYDEASKSKINPVIFAKNNNYLIDGKDPIVYAEELGLEIEGKKPIDWARENNRKVTLNEYNPEGEVISSRTISAIKYSLIPKPEEQRKLDKIKSKVSGFLKSSKHDTSDQKEEKKRTIKTLEHKQR